MSATSLDLSQIKTDALSAASSFRTLIGLGSLATQSGTFSGTSSGTNTGDQDLSSLLVKASNLSDVTNAATARTNLGLGTGNTPTFSGLTLGTSGVLVGGTNLIEQRNSTNAQRFNLYNTFTDASNYERLSLSFATYSLSRFAILRAESAGTGSADIGVVLGPKGTGAIVGQMPDGTVSGGNARGQYAVDLQTLRNANTQVASGSCSVIGGGFFNTSSGSYSTVGGGYGNTSSGYLSTVGGGYGNTSSGTSSTVGGGTGNTSSGPCSTVGGGQGNTNSGYGSTVGGGYNNTSSGTISTIGGGFRAKATRYGETSHASGRFAANGDAQHTILIVRCATTDATADVVLTLNGDTPGSGNRLTLPAETTWSFGIKLAAYNDTDNTGAWWTIRGGVRRDAADGTALIGSLIVERDSEGTMSGTSASIVADDTNEALEIRVTGLVSKNIRWVAVVDISQVSYGIP